MHTPDRENAPWDTATPAEIRQDLIDYAQPPADTRPTPSAGLLQQIPSTWVKVDEALDPRNQPLIDAITNLRKSFCTAGASAARAASSFEDLYATRARANIRQEMQGALARGDRKTYKRKLAELRKITPERY